MIKAVGTGPNGPIVVIGLTDKTVADLTAGRTTRIDMGAMGEGATGTLVLVHGKTDTAIADYLAKIGAIGPDTTVRVSPVGNDKILADHDQVLICTVGLPRSGKSTWARAQGYPVVNPDAIRRALTGQDFYGPAEPMVWATAGLAVNALFAAGHKVVIADATNVTGERRRAWPTGARRAVCFKEFDTSIDTCRARAADTNRLDLVSVIERMAAAREPLGDDDLRWE